MIPTAWQVRRTPPGTEVLVEVLAGLTKETLFAGACAATLGLPRFKVRFEDRRARHTVVLRLAMGLEDAVGLRFHPSMDAPFLRFTRPGDEAELSGHLARRPGYLPSAWLTDLLARWDVHETLSESWRAAGDDVRGNSSALESARLLRAALWHAARTDEPASAVGYVVDVVTTGLCRDVTGASRAITLLLWASAQADTGEALARVLFGGHLPDTAHAWTTAPLTEPAPAALPSRASPSVRMLVERTFALLEEARRADGFDTWFMALTRAAGMLHCVALVLRWVTERPAPGLRAVHGHVCELDAHYSALVAGLHVAGSPLMNGPVRHARALAARFRAAGDTTGDRFAGEALLIPPALLDEDEPLPDAWRDPGHLTATLLPRPPGLLDRLTPRRAVVADAANPARWHALAAELDAEAAPWAARVAAYLADVAAAGP